MDFEYVNFRVGSSSIPRSALIDKDRELVETRRIKLREEALKLEQTNYKLLEDHDRKVMERLSADLSEYSIFVPLYPELPPDYNPPPPLQSAPLVRSPVEEITHQVGPTQEFTKKCSREEQHEGHKGEEYELQLKVSIEGDKKEELDSPDLHTRKKQKLDSPESPLLMIRSSEQNEEERAPLIKSSEQSEEERAPLLMIKSSEWSEEERAPLLMIKSNEQNEEEKARASIEESADELLNRSHKPEPANNLLAHISEPVEDPITQNSECTEKCKLVENPITQIPEPAKNLITPKSEPREEPVHSTKPVDKYSITKKPESVKNSITQKSRPEIEPKTHLDKKQKEDVSTSRFIIKNEPIEGPCMMTPQSKGNTGTTTGTAILNARNKIIPQVSANKFKKKKRIPVPHTVTNIGNGNWFCEICEVKSNSIKALESHLQGQRHRAYLKAYTNRFSKPKPVKESSGPVTDDKGSTSSASTRQKTTSSFVPVTGTVMKEHSKGWLCTLCDVSVTSESNINDHLSGKRHRMNLETSGPGSGTVKACNNPNRRLLKRRERGKFGSGSGPVKPCNNPTQRPLQRREREIFGSGSGPVNPCNNPTRRPLQKHEPEIFGSGHINSYINPTVNPVHFPEHEIFGPGSGYGPVNPNYAPSGNPVQRHDPGSGPVNPCNGPTHNPVKMDLACVMCDFRCYDEKYLAEHFWATHQHDVMNQVPGHFVCS